MLVKENLMEYSEFNGRCNSSGERPGSYAKKINGRLEIYNESNYTANLFDPSERTIQLDKSKKYLIGFKGIYKPVESQDKNFVKLRDDAFPSKHLIKKNSYLYRDLSIDDFYDKENMAFKLWHVSTLGYLTLYHGFIIEGTEMSDIISVNKNRLADENKKYFIVGHYNKIQSL